ncbi:hypothetical protein ABG067_002001 [Albugo candida]
MRIAGIQVCILGGLQLLNAVEIPLYIVEDVHGKDSPTIMVTVYKKPKKKIGAETSLTPSQQNHDEMNRQTELGNEIVQLPLHFSMLGNFVNKFQSIPIELAWNNEKGMPRVNVLKKQFVFDGTKCHDISFGSSDPGPAFLAEAVTIEGKDVTLKEQYVAFNFATFDSSIPDWAFQLIAKVLEKKNEVTQQVECSDPDFPTFTFSFPDGKSKFELTPPNYLMEIEGTEKCRLAVKPSVKGKENWYIGATFAKTHRIAFRMTLLSTLRHQFSVNRV